MRKILAVFFAVAIFFLNVSFAFSQNYSQIAKDRVILDALDVLEDTHNSKAMKILDNKGSCLKIFFYDLSLLCFSYSNHYAIATSDNNGTDYILINIRLKDEPKEAIASLIAHELTHQLPEATMEEEIRAWTNEARQWITCKRLNPKLATMNSDNHRLIRRLNYIEKLYQRANNTNKLIAQEVKSNPVYNKLALNGL